MLWKGRLLFKHYIPAKRARFGVEIHKWSESASSYLWNSKVYAENGSDEIPSGAPSSIGMSCGVVVDIMSDDYHVYIDNWYTSIALFRYTRCKETDACRTLRKNRSRALPPTFHQKGLSKGKRRAFSNEKLLAMNYQDKKSV